MAAESPVLSLACDIADAIRHEGGRALVVGGFVRDRLLGHAVEGSRSRGLWRRRSTRLAGVLARFGRVEPVGQSFPVYKVGAIDVALPRRESKTGRGHKGFTVTGDPDMPFEEAARRRDFTINAIGWDPLTNEYLDPLRRPRRSRSRACCASSIPATFGDDSLRVLRALQFAARFDLTLDTGDVRRCAGRFRSTTCRPSASGASSRSCSVSRARPSIGLALALDLGVVDALLPELRPLVGCEQDVLWHPEGDVWVAHADGGG